MENLKNQKIHFIGIGGIGVSALARFFVAHGVKISGSDLASSELIEELKQAGVLIKTGPHRRTNIPSDTTLVVYTAAITPHNLEFLDAKRRKIKTVSYPELVGKLTKKFKTITISGSHGKSTTTALAALTLIEGYCDPTVIIGTKLKEFKNSNFRPGHGQFLVLEADEWNRAFLNYVPQIAIVTNIDAEHLDTYKNLNEVATTFTEYLKKVPKHGVIIANYDDSTLRRVARKFGKKVVWYSLRDPEAKLLKKILKIPGEHNLSNALAVYRLGQVLGIPATAVLKALSEFTGSWRRFEFKGLLNGAAVFDDYGHHPKEIMSTIAAARSRFPFRRIWCVYQPHQFQRLKYLWEEFVLAFDLADRICLLPVYEVAGRETKHAKHEVSSKELAHALRARGKNAQHFENFTDAKTFLRSHVRPGDAVLVMGAGTIYLLTPELLSSESPAVAVDMALFKTPNRAHKIHLKKRVDLKLVVRNNK